MPDDLIVGTSPEATSQVTNPTTTPTTPVTPTTSTETTPSSIAPSIEELQSKLSSYEPAYNFFQKYGGQEAIEPFFPVVDALSAPQFNPTEFAKHLATIDETRYNDFVWDAVERHKNDIATYLLQEEGIREEILGNNEEYQQFLQWKNLGGNTNNDEDLQLLEGLDPSDPLYAVVQRVKQRDAELKKLQNDIRSQKSDQERFRKQQAAIQQEQRAAAYVAEQENWLDQQVKSLNWGPEFSQDLDHIKDIVYQKFMADPEAKNALLVAATYSAKNSPIMAKRFTQVVQAKLSQIFKKVTEHENRKIQEIIKYRELIRDKQEARKEVASGGGRENTSLGSSEITGSTMEERIMQRIQRGVQAGRIPSIF